MIHVPNIVVEDILYLILDEWTINNHELDPFKHMNKDGSRIYVIYEQDAIISNIIHSAKEQMEYQLNSRF